MDEKPKCPKCGSDSGRKNGKKPNGTQSYRCNKCKTRFQVEYAELQGRPKGSRNYSHNVHFKAEKGEDTEEDFKTRVFIPKQTGPLPSSTSLAGIPCFGCIINDCKPKSCPKLDEWLGLYQYPLMVIAK